MQKPTLKKWALGAAACGVILGGGYALSVAMGQAAQASSSSDPLSNFDPRVTVHNGLLNIQQPQDRFDRSSPQYVTVPAAGFQGMDLATARKHTTVTVARPGFSAANDYEHKFE